MDHTLRRERDWSISISEYQKIAYTTSAWNADRRHNDAHFIVEAVNNHYSLKERIRELEEDLASTNKSYALHVKSANKRILELEEENTKLLEALKKCDETFGLFERIINALKESPRYASELVNAVDIDFGQAQAVIRDLIQPVEKKA